MSRLKNRHFDMNYLWQNYKWAFYHQTNQGHPIIIEKVGQTDVPNLLKAFTEQDIEDFYTQLYERMLNIVLTKASESFNKRIGKVVVIMDLEGVNIGKIFDSKFKKLIKITSKIS